MKKIEVIDYVVLEDEHGNTRAVTSAVAQGENLTRVHKGYSWRITTANGQVMRGLHRQPAHTIAEANAVAIAYGQRTDSKVITMQDPNELSPRELAAILAGLRLAQENHTTFQALPQNDGLEPLTIDELDSLCEKLNTACDWCESCGSTREPLPGHYDVCGACGGDLT